MARIDTKEYQDFDFDRWLELAQQDPDSFEAVREAVIENLIDSFPADSRERMRRLQWRIDQERRLAKSPMGSCLRLSKMMWRQLLGEGGLRDRLQELAGSLGGERQAAEPTAAPAGARVLAFSRAAD